MTPPSTIVRLLSTALLLTLLGAASPVYDKLVQTYLDSNWETLKTYLSPTNPDLANLSDAEKADIAYMRLTVAESRPAWWDITKAGKPTILNPRVWGKLVSASYDPSLKNGVSLRINNGVASALVNWVSADMDNPAQAEHGYTKGELADLGIWMQLGLVQAWVEIPVSWQINTSPNQQMLLSRYLDFRGDATGCYYGTPRARRWGLYLFLAAYEDKYAKMPTIMGRRATAAMFIQEIVAHRDKYPSIPLPDSLPDAGTETRLAEAIRNRIEHHPWTLAEDKSIREAIKAFMAANDRVVCTTGFAKLPSGLTVSMDIDQDAPLMAKRDAWEKQTFDAGAK